MPKSISAMPGVLRRLLLVLIACSIAACVQLVLPASASAVDDYPAYLRNAAQDSVVDPWGFYNRECTSFVAWRMNRDAGDGSLTNNMRGGHWGNAWEWAANAQNLGYPVDSSPAVGSIAWWSQTAIGGGYGHVAYVEAVNSGGTITVEEYNYVHGVYSRRTISAGSVSGYIHFHDGGGVGGVSEGSFVQVSGSPQIYRIAGGAPLYVNSWDAVGGEQSFSVISQSEFDALRTVPADGTYLRASNGNIYCVAGGAPLYVSDWGAVGGEHPYVGVDQWVFDNITDPKAHLRPVPADGTYLRASNGDIYCVAGGAPLYVNDWGGVGGEHPYVGVDQWVLDNITDTKAHLRPVPADGTFLRASNGSIYRVAGGSPFYISTWSIFGGEQPYVGVDGWLFDNLTNPKAHMGLRPGDGTVVQGLPSNTYWSFAGGYRRPAAGSPSAVDVDDAGLAAFPLASPKISKAAFANPIAYELKSFLSTQFVVNTDKAGVAAKLTLKTGGGTVTLFDAPIANGAGLDYKLPLWDGKVNGARLPSATYDWVLTVTKDGMSTTKTGKVIVSKILFSMSGTSKAGVANTHTGYMVPGNANVYVSAKTPAAADTLTIKLTGPYGFAPPSRYWALTPASPLSTTAYFSGTSAIKYRAVRTFKVTGKTNVTYAMTVIQ